MLEKILYNTIRKKKVTIFLMIVTMLFGIYSLYIVPKQEDPDINVSVALITTIFPGASPEEVDKLVTQKIAGVLPEVEGYSYLETYSKNSVSIAILRLNIDADVDKSWAQLKDKLANLRPDLPGGVTEVNINTDLADTAGIILSLSGAGYSYDELASYADSFRKELSKQEGIARFDIIGKQQNEIKVEVDLAKLNYQQISLQDIVNTLKAQNVEIPSGAINDNTSVINVTTNSSYNSIDDIGNTIIAVSKETGQVTRLKEIAEIYLGLEDASYKVKHNGNNAVLLTGYFKDNNNILITGKEIEAKLNELKINLPNDIIIDEVLYQPKDVNNAILGFMKNLLLGIIIVVVVVFISMGFRNAIIVSTAIPLSLLITFSMMYFLGIEIHQISITALIISLGMLVDNAIVISDAIQVKLDNGEERLAASVNGAKEVAIPVLTSTLTTVFAFIPLLILPGMAGEFISSLPQIIMIALSASYLVAMLVSPTMAYIFFKKSKNTARGFVLRAIFEKLLNLSFKMKKTLVLITIIIFAGSIYLVSILGLQFFPKSDKNLLYITLSTEQFASLAETEAVVEELEGIIKEQNEVTSFTTSIGGGLPKFYFSVPPMANSKDSAQILLRVDLNKGKFNNNTELANQLQIAIDKRLVGATATVRELEQGEPIGSPIVVRVTGENIERLKEVAINIKQILSEIDGTINIEDDISKGVYEYAVNVDIAQASRLGLSNYDIQREINLALSGQQAIILRNSTDDYNVSVKGNISSKSELENIGIKSTLTGNKFLLKQVAKIELAPQIPRIYKYDRELAITVNSGVLPGYSSIDIQNTLDNKLQQVDISEVAIVYAGEEAKIKENFGGMGEAAVFIVFIIFTILLLQFNSIVQPFIIILTIPLSITGSIVGLYLLKQPLSFTALLGMVSLMGIVVNNAIVLVDYINGQRALGIPLDDACKSATKQRFRPVMLTTFTTVIGLTPLAISGSNLFVPMSIAIISGLLISTILTLIVIPVVYSLIEGWIERTTNRRKRNKRRLTTDFEITNLNYPNA